MASEETEEELEAAVAVYGNDCTIISCAPPHLVVRLQPRTAYDISLQYVEAVLVIKASAEYPRKPPMLELKDTKGLEEEKVANLALELENLAHELIFNPMLVAICEAALDRLTEMNQPDGNCCFCMEPLVTEDGKSKPRPFMKLLSCFHCFHSDCFGRWWRWILQKQNLDYLNAFSCLGPEEDKDSSELIARCEKLLGEIELKCPVCRKSIDAQDLASVWSALAFDPTLTQDQEEAIVQEPEILLSKSEVERKVRFDQLLRAQQGCGGIIEPRKLEVIVPGMYVTFPLTRAASCSELREEDASASSIIQASESSSSLTEVAAEADSLSQDTVNSRSTTEQVVDARIGRETGGSTESMRQFNSQHNDRHRRKGGRSNAGGKKGQWIRRDREGNK